MSEGKKNDAGKLRWDLVPWAEMKQVVEVLTDALKEYEPNSWQHVPGARDRYAAALFRHAADYATGERADSDSGLPTLAHVVCNALFLMWFDSNGISVSVGTNDSRSVEVPVDDWPGWLQQAFGLNLPED